MHTSAIKATAKALVADYKGILAIDESLPTCNKRFAKLGIPQSVESRRNYRELLITTPGLSDFISGMILFDETIRQKTLEGVPFIKIIEEAGIIPGIKVDMGTKDLAGHPQEKITQGLDGLRERLADYHRLGARFAKWRAVLVINTAIPSQSCIDANAQALARFASLCQEAGLVPIVEPEVLMDGNHSLARCNEVTEKVLRSVFNHLSTQRVLLEGMILKCNMILPGLACQKQESLVQVAEATVKCLLRAVPPSVPGIAFLSGGQSSELASARLNEMNLRFKSKLPWELSFSFGRALHQRALEIWKGLETNVPAAQQSLLHRAKCNGAARHGLYTHELENSSKTNPGFFNDKEDLPGYPVYPAEEDIYSKYHEGRNIDPEDVSKTKSANESNVGRNLEINEMNETGDDLDIPGLEQNDNLDESLNEDEENNYFSLGGDAHEDLEEYHEERIL